ncbi:MAG: MFS transporter [bacterium]
MEKKLLTYTSYLYLVSYAFVVTSFGLCNKPIADAFNVGERSMGLLISTHYTGLVVMTVCAGFLADRIGLKPVMVGSVSFLGLSLIGLAKSWNTPSLFVMMLFTGFAGGAIESTVNALISRLYSDTRTYSLNKLHIFFGVGAFTWPMIGGQLLRAGVDWRLLFVVLGIFSLAMAVVIAFQEFPGHDRSEVIRFSEMFGLLKQPAMLIIGLLVALYAGAEMGINAWIVRYFEDELLNGSKVAMTIKAAFFSRHMALPVTTGLFLTLYWFSMTAGRLLVTIAGRRFPDYILLRALTTCAAIAGLGIFITGNVIVAAVFLILTGFFFSGIFATSIAIGNNRFPSYAGSVSGIIIAFSGVGNMALNSGIGEISQRFGSIKAGMFFASIMLIGMAACSFAIRKDPVVKTI